MGNPRKRHAETLYQCDFFFKRIVTKFGLQQYFVLVYLHLGSRRVYMTKCTRTPNATWMKEQAKKFVEHVKTNGQEITLLFRDRDGIYRSGFDNMFRDAGIKVRKNSIRAPNLQAHIERFIQSLHQEALDHFIVFGEQHFDYLISEYAEHCHIERPHQALGNVPITGDWPKPENDSLDSIPIECRTRLGGVLRHYERRAA